MIKMNKKISVIICTIIMLSIAFTLVACNNKKTDSDEEQPPISYMQTLFYIGKDNEYRVKLIQGRGETLFIADGKQSGNVVFTTLTVTPLNRDQANNKLTYTLIGDKGETSDSLSYEKLQGYFSATPDISSIGTPSLIKIQEGKRVIEIKLENLLEGKLTADEALSVAEDTLKDKITLDDKDREIYIRLINNSLDPNSEYYWYVAFIASPTDYYSVLINSETGAILSTNP